VADLGEFGEDWNRITHRGSRALARR